MDNFAKLHENFTSQLALALTRSSFTTETVPIGFKKVHTPLGACFFMVTKLSGTTERKYQGNLFIVFSIIMLLKLTFQVGRLT